MVSRVGAHATNLKIPEAPDTAPTAPASDPERVAAVDPSPIPTPAPTRTPQTIDFARKSARAGEERLRMYYLRSVTPPSSSFTLANATAAIDTKIDPKLGNMDPTTLYL